MAEGKLDYALDSGGLCGYIIAVKLTTTIRFRVSPVQEVRFRRLAAKMNLNLSCWIRVMLLEASKRKYALPSPR